MVTCDTNLVSQLDYQCATEINDLTLLGVEAMDIEVKNKLDMRLASGEITEQQYDSILKKISKLQ